MKAAMMRAAIGLALLVIVIAPVHAAEIAFPALTGRVVDQANILSAETERAVANASTSLEAKTTNQLVVATLASLQGQTIEDFGYQLGRQWGIGRAGKNNGILLIVAPRERAVRIEVGYGLEGTITDAVSRGIIEQEILPRFRDNDYDAGVRAGVATIAAILMGDANTASRLTEVGSLKVVPQQGNWNWMFILFVVAFFILPRLFGGSRMRRGLGGLGGLWLGGLGGRRGGGFGGGGFGGGGFQGGGGSFGGGGASGRW
jgi:uncharacterized protein